MKKLLLLFTICTLFCASLYAQTAEITGVRKNEFRGVRGIKNKGYYTFYINEKVGKGMIEFMLEIYDLELKVIKKTPITITKHSRLLGGEFNGKDFLFLFDDYQKKTNTFVTVDGDGNILKEEVRKMQKRTTVGTTEIYPSMDGDGFYITSMVKEKKWGYSVEKIDRNMSVLWEKTVTRDKGIIGIDAAETGKGQLILITVERPALMSKKVLGNIVCMDGKDGKEKFQYPLFDGKTTGIPSAFLIDKEGNIVTAGMYFDGEKWDNTNSDGIFFLKLSKDGKKLAYNSIDWDNGIQQALKATSRKFSIGSKPKVLFHEIVQAPTGEYQIISETYRKTVKLGTVLSMMNNSSEPPPMGFTVMDYIIFNYDNNGKPLDINKIEKPYKSITVDGNIANSGGVALAYYMKRYKMFTFEFATKLTTSEQVIVYSNYEDETIGAGKPYVGITTITPGKESVTTKIPLERKLAKFVQSPSAESKTGALEGKPGKVCIYFYDKKTKTINFAIEDLKL